MARTPAILNLTTQKDNILNLQYGLAVHHGARNESKWIGALGHSGSVIVFDREQQLRMNYVSDDRKSILIQLDDQSSLYEVLADVETKVKIANAPHQDITNDLINHAEEGSGYMPSIKLKTEYTRFVDENGDAISNETALSERRTILSLFRNYCQRTQLLSRTMVFCLCTEVCKSQYGSNTRCGSRRRTRCRLYAVPVILLWAP